MNPLFSVHEGRAPLDQSMPLLGQLPRLTPQEEEHLLRQVARARVERASAHPDALLMEQGQRARCTLIEAGQRLVISLARLYVEYSHSMTLCDLMQEGTIGLIQAIDSYTSTPGYAYTTWAGLKIKDAMRTALYQRDRIIRLPARLIDRTRRFHRVQNQLALTLGRTPTTRDLAEAMQVDERQLAPLLCLGDYTPRSLHAPIDAEEERVLADRIQAPALVLPAAGWHAAEWEREASEHEQRLQLLTQVRALLGEVAERERAVITLRYGLGESPEECRCHSYEEIGRLLALHPGRVCLIEQRALFKLRLALTYYTPAQAAARLGVKVKQLDQLVKRGQLTRQVVPPYTTRTHYRRDEVDALAAQGQPIEQELLEAAYAALSAQGQKIPVARLCQRARVSGKVASAFLRARQRGPQEVQTYGEQVPGQGLQGLPMSPQRRLTSFCGPYVLKSMRWSQPD